MYFVVLRFHRRFLVGRRVSPAHFGARVPAKSEMAHCCVLPRCRRAAGRDVILCRLAVQRAARFQCIADLSAAILAGAGAAAGRPGFGCVQTPATRQGRAGQAAAIVRGARAARCRFVSRYDSAADRWRAPYRSCRCNRAPRRAARLRKAKRRAAECECGNCNSRVPDLHDVLRKNPYRDCILPWRVRSGNRPNDDST